MFKHHRQFGVLSVVLAALLLVAPVKAQERTPPTIEIADQLSLDGTVTVARAVANSPAFVAIHADNGQGSFGEVIGYASINAGENLDIRVPIDPARATPTLFAVLHTDDYETGAYEFGLVEGADAPITANGKTVVSRFNADILLASDQIVNNQVTIAYVTVHQPSWVVIHAGDAQGFGDVIGQILVEFGTSTNITVPIDSVARTDIVWPMLHADTGIEGQFEFDTIEGADLPLIMDNKVATLPILTVPSIRVADNQFTLDNNGIVSGDTASVVVQSVLSDGPGFLVIHNEVNGGMGDVIGFTPVPSGLSTHVAVEVNPQMVTSNLWPALHVDTGTAGQFEFGAVADADAPVVVNGQVVAFPVRVAAFLSFNDLMLDSDRIVISQALIDGPGFVIVQADDGTGSPGPVLGQVSISPGLNENIVVPFNPDSNTGTLYLALYSDTNQIGVFESGTVEGADSPVLVNNQAILGHLTLTGSESAMTNACIATIAASTGANLRSGPGTNFDVVGVLTGDATIALDGQAKGTDGLSWWQTTDGNWIRSDVVAVSDECETLSP